MLVSVSLTVIASGVGVGVAVVGDCTTTVCSPHPPASSRKPTIAHRMSRLMAALMADNRHDFQYDNGRGSGAIGMSALASSPVATCTARSRLEYPLAGGSNGLLPGVKEAVALIGAPLRLEDAAAPPGLLELVRTRPDAHRETREVGGAERRRLHGLRAFHRQAQDVGEVLEEKIVCGGAAVDPQAGRCRCRRVFEQRLQYLAAPIGNAFEHGADDVGAGAGARQAADNRTRVRIHVRRSQPLKGRHRPHAAAIGYLRSQPTAVFQLLQHTETVAQPLHRGAGADRRAFETEGAPPAE